MNTEELEPSDLPCRYRGKSIEENIFSCKIHGMCSMAPIHSRVTCCMTCKDAAGANGEDVVLAGDLVKSVLSSIGVTKERVEHWLGEPCNCEERVRKLNEFHAFIASSVKRKKDAVKHEFEKLLAKRT